MFPWINTRSVSIVHDNQRLIWEGDLHRCRLTTKSYRVGSFTVPISTPRSSQTSNKVQRRLVRSRPSSSLINFKNSGLIFYSLRLASVSLCEIVSRLGLVSPRQTAIYVMYGHCQWVPKCWLPNQEQELLMYRVNGYHRIMGPVSLSLSALTTFAPRSPMEHAIKPV